MRSLRTHNRFVMVLLTSVIGWLTSPVQAIPLGFVDNGTTTRHDVRGLEWLDVTQTVNRSYTEIATELGSGNGLGAGGWRFATDQELQRMLSGFFAITYTGGPFTTSPFGPGDNPLVDEFIGVFGDTFASFLDLSGGALADNSLGVTANATTSGYTNGFYASSPGTGNLASARFVFDFAVTRTNGNLFDSDDAINGHALDTSTRYTDLGSWLVRPVTIPEPGTTVLLCLGLALMSGHRGRCRRPR